MSVSEPGDNLVLGSAVTSTLIAAGSGGVTVLVIWKFMPGGDGVWSLAKTINGMLAGTLIHDIYCVYIILSLLQHIDYSLLCNYTLFLGMVSVCGGCDAYYPWAALFLGSIAGALHLLASIILVKMKIDDPLDAAPIHFVCGKVIYVTQHDCELNFLI